MKLRYLLITLGCICTQLFARCPAPSSVYIPRSMSRDKARQIVGTMSYTHRPRPEWWGIISSAAGYSHSFNPAAITRALFGKDSCATHDGQEILIQGSLVPNRSSRAWLADYFYLPPDFQSTVRFDPTIRNVFVDFDIYVGMDPWWEGLYARLYAPLIHTTWDLHASECITDTGVQSYRQGYFASIEVPRNLMNKSFLQYAQGGNIPSSVDEIRFGRLLSARIPTCSLNKTRFADIRLEIGWDFCHNECRHLGINIQCAAPSGNKPDAEVVFSPIVGNGGHWELGGGLTAHQVMYESVDETKQVVAHIDASLTHVFGVFQERTFDVCGKPNSRYMLTALLDRPIENNLSASPTSNVINQDDPVVNPNSQFMKQYAPLANLSTDFVKVSNSVQADIVALLQFVICNWSIDVGYNFWAIGCERVECPEAGGSNCARFSLCTSGQEDRWAFKGDARMFGFMIEAGTTLPEGAPVALSATESAATINQGTNIPFGSAGGGLDPYNRNFAVDIPRFAYADSSNTALEFEPAAGVDLERQIKTTLIPQFISCTQLNFQRLSGRSHKLFLHISYDWACTCYDVHFGAGGSGEFGSNSRAVSRNNLELPSFNLRCSDCLRASLSQWMVWIKGGIAF